MLYAIQEYLFTSMLLSSLSQVLSIEVKRYSYANIRCYPQNRKNYKSGGGLP